MGDTGFPCLEDELRGFAAVAEACARALVNEPSSDVVRDVRRVARALGMTRFDRVEPGAALRQRYYDRFFVSAGPLFAPLVESCVRGAQVQDGRRSFGVAGGPAADHALRCYRAVGFDYRALEGFAPAVAQLRPDSMACELAFMASLARCACEGGEDAAAARSVELLRRFAREHAAGWFGAAAEALRRADDDFYAGVCALAAEAADVWAQ